MWDRLPTCRYGIRFFITWTLYKLLMLWSMESLRVKATVLRQMAQDIVDCCCFYGLSSQRNNQPKTIGWRTFPSQLCLSHASAKRASENIKGFLDHDDIIVILSAPLPQDNRSYPALEGGTIARSGVLTSSKTVAHFHSWHFHLVAGTGTSTHW